jgi:hypothetical protein
MQSCETSTEKGSFVKRVSVRTGGAGHAHSGIAKVISTGANSGVGDQHKKSRKVTNGRIVRIGR